MSVTFWCPDAPRNETPCRWCVEDKAKGKKPNKLGGYCDPYCCGHTLESESPEANFGNQNAQAILTILGVDTHGEETPCGAWSLAAIPVMRRKIMLLQNSDTKRRPATWEQHEEQGAVRVSKDEEGLVHIDRGCQSINCGSSDEQVVRRLGSLDTLLAYAQEHGFGVSWG